MPYLLMRHEVRDFRNWKPVYDDHEQGRREAGIKELHLFRNANNPNEIVTLFEVDDVSKARQFIQSDTLREEMQRAGVVDEPSVYFLDKA